MRDQFLNYWAKPLPRMESASLLARVGANQTKTLVTIAFLGALTALFQSAGGFFPGPGYLLSLLSTAPVVLAALISFRSGLTAYALSIVLLLLIQPSELIVFPFTTGLLGLALGFSIARSKNRIQVVLFSALALWTGIALVLYALHFPLLGPSVALSFDIATATYIFLFSLLYSAIWTEISLRLLARLRKSVHGL
ncbi:YybS family protein [Paenibacillus oleatilyticus]|uniref:YybS family protein n=1 Tax=Paenibacillus oleatilyticus TaxID=2594886 RepID=UPI001C1F8B2F|nr:YybS family protein [Paenibacillus oleatilyticus]MBU7320215.1 YybS family protein [Paenibacillus oleatilyticus]